jgi:hypothetical protein
MTSAVMRAVLTPDRPPCSLCWLNRRTRPQSGLTAEGVQKSHLLGDLPRVGERVLEQALRAALEGTVAQRHQPQQAGHPRTRGRQAAAHHDQICGATCKQARSGCCQRAARLCQTRLLDLWALLLT